MQVSVDTREPPSFCEALAGMNPVRKCLDVGDIWIETDNRLIVIERKTKQDLCSSIMDGRYRAQKSRMLEFAENNTKETLCIYLLEGRDTVSPGYRKMFDGAVSSLVCSGYFSVVFSQDMGQTVTIVEAMSRKIQDEFVVKPESKRRKRTGIAEKNPLLSIPGIGPKAAAELAKAFPDTGLAELLNFPREVLIAGGVSKRTATSLVKAAKQKIV